MGLVGALMARNAGHPPRRTCMRWFGLGAPRNTPSAIVDKLNGEASAALADAALKASLLATAGAFSPAVGRPDWQGSTTRTPCTWTAARSRGRSTDPAFCCANIWAKRVRDGFPDVNASAPHYTRIVDRSGNQWKW